MKNSEILSIKESKKPPNFVDLFNKRAIAPSQPSKIPVIKTRIEKSKRFRRNTNEKQPRIEKKSIKTVAKFGVTPILINPLAIRLTKGLKIYRILNLEGIIQNILWDNLKYILQYKIT